MLSLSLSVQLNPSRVQFNTKFICIAHSTILSHNVWSALQKTLVSV